MKKWTSLALLGLTSATLLVACGSKKEENSSSVKETQTSMKSGQNKTKQSSKKKNTKETESSSEETTQSSQTTTASKIKPAFTLALAPPSPAIQQVVTKLQIHLKWFLQSW